MLQLIRHQIDGQASGERFVVVGPSVTINDLVRSSMLHAIDTLAELAHHETLRDVETQTRLAEAAVAAHAWVDTFRDAYAVEWFSFDPHGAAEGLE